MVIIIKTIIGNVVIALLTNLATNYAEITVNACYLHCTALYTYLYDFCCTICHS